MICKLAQSWGAKKVIGVDIDATLISAAWKRRRTVWSQSYVAGADDTSIDADNIALDPEPPKKRKRTDEPRSEADGSSNASTSDVIADYFPASCEHMFGPLPILPSEPTTSYRFPHNAVFQTADWVTTEISEDAQGYDVVVA